MSVRPKIRTRIARGGDLSPAAVSRDVLAALPDDQLRDALAQALPYLVRDEIRKVRHDSVGQPDTRNRGREAWDALADPDAEPEALPRRYKKADLQARRQSAQQNIKGAHEKREAQSALMRTPLSVNGEWKPLGDCTAEDLRAIATSHRKDASERDAKARGFEQLADALVDAGATTVSDLKGSHVRELFGAVV